jgi:PPK2 family polyphosphate:nucleotide phosphotransferase
VAKKGSTSKKATKPGPPHWRVTPGAPVRLADIDPGENEDYQSKKDVEPLLSDQRERIANLQAKLYADPRHALLVVLQAMDTGGKDGTIKHVFRGVNPQGCRVTSFKQPSEVESRHDFLWRIHPHVPPRGMIGLFNRSHYEDVLVVRVKGLQPEKVWRPRYEIINDFERALAADGVTVLKFFLHISKDEQKERLEARLADKDKLWKFDTGDLAVRAKWVDYQRAYEEAISLTSTAEAPWYVIPANRKWYRNLVISNIIVERLEALGLRHPEPEDLEGIVVV